MDFPSYEQQEISVTDEMESAFSVRPVKAILGPDLVCIFESEEQIRNMKPDQAKLAGLPGRGQSVTAKGKDIWRTLAHGDTRTLLRVCACFQRRV